MYQTQKDTLGMDKCPGHPNIFKRRLNRLEKLSSHKPLSQMYKLFTKILTDRINQWIENAQNKD